MIYIIDDNQANQRLKNYNISFVDDDTFSDLLISLDKLPSTPDPADFEHLRFLSDSKCILLHATTEDVDSKGEFQKGRISNVTKIREFISVDGEKIPLVLFSNKMNRMEYNFDETPNFISALKKNLLYERLFDFLENYRNTGVVELRILASGKDFLQDQLEILGDKILAKIASMHDDDIVKITDIGNINDFRKFMVAADLGHKFDAILLEIEDTPVNVGKIRSNINSINESFTKHGQNLHTWV